MKRSKKDLPLRRGAPPCANGPLHSSKSALQRLIEASPIKRGSIPSQTRYFLINLGFGKGLTCLGDGYWNCSTEELSKITKRLEDMGVVVPALMISRYGKLKNNPNELGPRTNANTGELLFVVVAPEVGSLDDQARSFLELKRIAPLVAVVQRHPDQLEGWFAVKGWTSQRIQNLRRAARGMGAPPTIFTDCHPYAIPCGFNHEKQCRQPVIFWDLSAV
jgi:hypothetical protein